MRCVRIRIDYALTRLNCLSDLFSSHRVECLSSALCRAVPRLAARQTALLIFVFVFVFVFDVRVTDRTDSELRAQFVTLLSSPLVASLCFGLLPVSFFPIPISIPIRVLFMLIDFACRRATRSVCSRLSKASRNLIMNERAIEEHFLLHHTVQ